jgi:hypothetical protein
MIKAVMFDFGHTIMDELQYRDMPLRSRPVSLMPGVLEAASNTDHQSDMGQYEKGDRSWHKALAQTRGYRPALQMGRYLG